MTAIRDVQHVEAIAWAGREVPIGFLVGTADGQLERFVHLTPESNPMARFVIGFAACPRWRDAGHRYGDDHLLLTLWLSPSSAHCSACGYVETLTAFMARMGWERTE